MPLCKFYPVPLRGKCNITGGKTNGLEIYPVDSPSRGKYGMAKAKFRQTDLNEKLSVLQLRRKTILDYVKDYLPCLFAIQCYS